jgi:tricorn protease interacting factor F2/3
MDCPRYQLRLEFDEVALRFEGQVEIDLRGVTDAELRLNACDLEIARAEIDGAPYEVELAPEREELVIRGAPLGDHQLAIEFRGRVLEKGLIGLYRSAFGARTIITSMLFPNGARRVFPCVDEPASKAVFEVTLVVDAGSAVVFNTRPKSSQSDGGRKEIAFEPTPVMSTYLLYFGIGPFAFVEGHHDGILISVALPAGREPSGRFALEHAGKVLGAYASYYRIPYPLPKLHLVCVPDFWAGAQENWGAIAFLETRLLVDATTSARIRRRTRETITHEIAHQWFGNLVTNRSWNDFWLNESFASFMQAKMDGLLYPELDLWPDFLLRFSRWGFNGDVLWSTHAIEMNIARPEDLGEAVDEITYGKGSSVLRMIETYLGEDAFRAGVTRYLERFAYRSTRGRDLWQALEETAHEPVTRIMEDWIRTPGHPTVMVRREGERLLFEQRRSSLDGRTDESVWPIPLTYSVAGRMERRLMTGRTDEAPVPADADILVNPGRTGFYRVQYVGELQDRMLARYDHLADVDRWALLMDAFGFLLSAAITPTEYGQLLERARAHPTPLTTGEVAGAFDELRSLLPHLPGLERSFQTYFAETLDRIGVSPVPGEPEAIAGMRGQLTLARARSDPAFASSLAAGFSSFDTLPGDLRSATAAAFGMSAEAGVFAVLRDKMFAAPTEEYAGQMVVGLSHLEGPARIDDSLRLVLDPRMPAQRSWVLLSGLCLNTSASDHLWGWLAERLPEVEHLLHGTPLLSRLLEDGIPSVGVGRSGAVRTYFERPGFPEARQGIRKGLERLEIQRRFLERNGIRVDPANA